MPIKSQKWIINKDDIGFKYGECESPDFVSVTCDFEEQHICGYESDEKADFNWSRNKGNTLTIQTGPSVDVNFLFFFVKLHQQT